MEQASPYALRSTTSLSFAEAEERLRQLLAAEGFGIQTEIDVAATLKSNLGVVVPACRILGACNPDFAHRALELEPLVAVLMPCNVALRELGSQREVKVLDPAFMGTVQASLDEVGQAASSKLRAVLERLEAEAPATV